MPIVTETEEVQVTKENTTTWYTCADPECDERVKNFSPKEYTHDYDDFHYVAVNPRTVTAIRRGETEPYSAIDETVGVYVCSTHLPKVGEYLARKWGTEDE